MWIVIWCVHSSSCCLIGQLAVDQQVGDLEVGRVLGELLDRIPAVLQDALLAVEVRDRGATRGRVHEGRVIGHDAEVFVVDLDVAQRGRPDGPVLDRDLVGLAGAVVGDRQGVRRRSHATTVLALLLSAHFAPLEGEGQVSTPIVAGSELSGDDGGRHHAHDQHPADQHQAGGEPARGGKCLVPGRARRPTAPRRRSPAAPRRCRTASLRFPRPRAPRPPATRPESRPGSYRMYRLSVAATWPW